jgi:hypothetical protein
MKQADLHKLTLPRVLYIGSFAFLVSVIPLNSLAADNAPGMGTQCACFCAYKDGNGNWQIDSHIHYQGNTLSDCAGWNDGADLCWNGSENVWGKRTQCTRTNNPYGASKAPLHNRPQKQPLPPQMLPTQPPAAR